MSMIQINADTIVIMISTIAKTILCAIVTMMENFVTISAMILTRKYILWQPLGGISRRYSNNYKL